MCRVSGACMRAGAHLDGVAGGPEVLLLTFRNTDSLYSTAYVVFVFMDVADYENSQNS